MCTDDENTFYSMYKLAKTSEHTEVFDIKTSLFLQLLRGLSVQKINFTVANKEQLHWGTKQQDEDVSLRSG